jgi:DNA-directed RNA polymerase
MDDEVDERVEYITAQSIAEMFPHRKEFRKRNSISWGGRTLDLELGEDVSYEAENSGDSDVLESEDDARALDLGLDSAEMLNRFDPQKPPSMDRLEELQLWLECEAQQEAVLKYQKVIENARKRKDYSSLSLVQRQVLWWFQPLVDAIEKRQKEYIFREKSEGDVSKSAQRFGPFLCTLPPAKLAVIAAHTAIMETLTNSNNSLHGTPFSVIARQLGQAVEDEVIIQRILHQRYKESHARASVLNVSNILDGEATDDDLANSLNAGDGGISGEQKIKPAEEDPMKKWTYSTSHLQNYLDELKEFKPKSQRLASFAIWRARQVLENDEQWTERDKIQLGAALFKVLLDCATVKDGGRKGEPAFLFEKRWTRKDKSRAYVTLNEKLRNMVVSDRLQSFSQTTTRQKPMILPPKPWTKPKEGGYLWLKSDLVRYHGCDLQLVSDVASLLGIVLSTRRSDNALGGTESRKFEYCVRWVKFTLKGSLGNQQEDIISGRGVLGT